MLCGSASSDYSSPIAVPVTAASAPHRRLATLASHMSNGISGGIRNVQAAAAMMAASMQTSPNTNSVSHLSVEATSASSSSSPSPSGCETHNHSPQSDASCECEGMTALSSRQIPLFYQENTQLQKADPTNIQINDIVVHSIPRIHSFLPNLQEYPNRFARTKASVMLQRATAVGAAAAAPPPLADPSRRSGNAASAHIPLLPAAPSHEAVSSSSDLWHREEVQYNQLIKEGDVVLLDIVRRSHLGSVHGAKSFVRAGPREKICWAPGEAVAAIVTCGGLCPGLNDVIAELFNTLYYNYGVNRIHGIRNGFRGFWDPRFYPWLDLTPDLVRGIDALGGTVLGSSRGGFNLDAIMQACMNRGVNQLYIIGGDGTHRAADAIQHEARRRKIKMTVACVPKTIDNDIGVIDRSFGFNTAVAEARKAIQSAVVEASCAPNGLGIVQLMGRHAGYIAAHATLASRQVDLCLIPEIPFPLDGPTGVLSLTEGILKRQGYGVIVVAEGAGADLLQCTGTDESGNKKLPEIGKFLQAEIAKHFASKKLDVSIKYHDPSYMIRSISADAGDSVYCMTLAQNCVHGAMSGFTGFTSGLVNNRTVLIPISVITATSPSYLSPYGRTWERVISLTHQPMREWERIAEEKKKEAQKEAALVSQR